MRSPSARQPVVAKWTTTAIGVLMLTGCLPLGGSQEPEGWSEVEDRRLAELQDDSWLGGTAGDQSHRAYGWQRPSVHRESPSADHEPWREAAAEVHQAEAAGWAPVFVTCSAPEGVVQVDLVRELSDGSPATARIVAGPAAADGDHPVDIRAVALHHLDGDWVRTPPTAAPPDFDAGTCLQESGEDYDPRWSGTPVMLDVEGDSPPAG